MTIKEKVTNYFDNFCDYMQNDTKGLEIGVYTASGILFAIAYYKIRPITRFGKSNDIPTHFIRDKIKQYGTIKGVDPTSGGPLLLVKHNPPLHYIIPSKKLLPVKLSGITVNGNGYSWLQTVAVNHNLEFLPLARHGDTAECQVQMICPNNKKVRIDISEALLSLGFAKLVDPPRLLSEDPALKRYYQQLSLVEKRAKNDRTGLWSLSLPPLPWPIRKVKETYRSIIGLIPPPERRLPELVR